MFILKLKKELHKLLKIVSNTHRYLVKKSISDFNSGRNLYLLLLSVNKNANQILKKQTIIKN